MRSARDGSRVGLDVFAEEPLAAEHPLRSTDGVLTTPHLGYVADDVYVLFFRQVVEDIVAFAAGEPVEVLAHRAGGAVWGTRCWFRPRWVLLNP